MGDRVLSSVSNLIKRGPGRPFYSNSLSLADVGMSWDSEAVCDETASSHSRHSCARMPHVKESCTTSPMSPPVSESTASSSSTNPLDVPHGPYPSLSVRELEGKLDRLAAATRNVSNNAGTMECIEYLARHFDILSLPEAVAALRLVRMMSRVPGLETNPRQISLVPDLVARIEYLIKHSVDLSSALLISSAVALLNLPVKCSESIGPSIDLVFSRLSRDDIFSSEELVFASARHPLARLHIITAIGEASTLRVSSLPLACGLLDIFVLADPYRVCQNTYVLLRQISRLTHPDHLPVDSRSLLRPLTSSLNNLLRSEVVPDAIWSEKELVQILSQLSGGKLMQDRPSWSNLVVATCMARGGGRAHYRSSSVKAIVENALAWSSTDPVHLKMRLEIIRAFSCDPIHLQKISIAELTHGGLVAGYAKCLSVDESTGIADTWSVLFERLVALREMGHSTVGDLIDFAGAVSSAKGCPQTVSSMIERSLFPLIILDFRNSPSATLPQSTIEAVRRTDPVSALGHRLREESVSKLVSLVRSREEDSANIGDAVFAISFINETALGGRPIASGESLSVLREYCIEQLASCVGRGGGSLSCSEMLELVSTVLQKDVRWDPLADFASEHIQVHRLSVPELVRLGTCFSEGGGRVWPSKLVREWKQRSFHLLLPADKVGTTGGVDTMEVPVILAALLRKQERMQAVPVQSGKRVGPVKAVCGTLLVFTVATSWWIDPSRVFL